MLIAGFISGFLIGIGIDSLFYNSKPKVNNKNTKKK